jgi:hypothetical protein
LTTGRIISIIEARGLNDGCYQSSDFPKTSDAEQYYNETFGGQDNE